MWWPLYPFKAGRNHQCLDSVSWGTGHTALLYIEELCNSNGEKKEHKSRELFVNTNESEKWYTYFLIYQHEKESTQVSMVKRSI